MVESDRIIEYLYHVGVRKCFNHFRKWLQTAIYTDADIRLVAHLKKKIMNPMLDDSKIRDGLFDRIFSN